MKRDWIHEVTKWVDYHRYSVVATVLVGAAAVWLYGCQSTTTSPLTGERVTWVALDAEVEGYNAESQAKIEAFLAGMRAEAVKLGAQYEAAFADLERQDAMKAAIFEAVAPVAQTALGQFGSVFAAIGAAGLLGGVAADNRRKNKIIAAKPQGA